MLLSGPAFVIPKHCGSAVVKWPLVPCWFADLILWYFLKADFFNDRTASSFNVIRPDVIPRRLGA